jgi:transposase
VVIIGLDPHPDSHTLAALDENRAVLGHLRVENEPEEFERLWQWAAQFSKRYWAIEGANNPFIAPLVSELVSRGEKVVPISPNLTSQYRSRRGKKKDDPIDAENAARALWANPELPAYLPSQAQRDLQALSRTRARLARQLQTNRTALAQLTPDTPAQQALARVVELLRQELTRLDKELGSQVKEQLPELLALQGVGPCVAAVILAEVGDIERFHSQDHFASYCGAAPISRASGKSRQVRVNPGGNRRLNWALHIIAINRLRRSERSQSFSARKQREGKTKREVLRILKTYIARELYRFLRQLRPPQPIIAA